MLINLTPHPVRMRRIDGSEVTLPPHANGPARVSTSEVVIAEADGFPVVCCHYGSVVGLPDETEGVRLLVSRMVAQALRGLRTDLYIPSRLYRDQSGAIIGAEALEVIQ